MFINNSEVNIRLSKALDIFLYGISIENSGIFYNHTVEENMKLNTEDFESYIPKNNLAVAEEYLYVLLKTQFTESNDPEMSKTLIKILDYYVKENEVLLSNNLNHYQSWWSRVKINSKQEVANFIEQHTSQEVSSTHKELIESSSKVFFIPSLYVYPQVGYNFIDGKAIILIGITKNEMMNKLPYHIVAQGFKALGEEKRLEILSIIGNSNGIQGKEIAKKIKLTPATVSHHLNTLVQAGIISRQRNGREVSFVLESRIKYLSDYLNNIR